MPSLNVISQRCGGEVSFYDQMLRRIYGVTTQKRQIFSARNIRKLMIAHNMFTNNQTVI